MSSLFYKVIGIMGIVALSGCGKVARKTALEVSEVVTREGGEKIVKNKVIRETEKEIMQKGLKRQAGKMLMEIPEGKGALEVVELMKGKYVPKINNLGDEALRFSDDFNSRLLKVRRAAISPYLQFPTQQQLAGVNREALSLGKKANAATLKENMLAVMPAEVRRYINAFGGAAAHHLVEGTDEAAMRSREILKRFHIDINGPENGIFLPTDRNSIYKGTLHKTGHSKEYSEYVYNELKGCTSREEVIKKLNGIGHSLYNGKIQLEGNLHAVNKNVVNL